MIQKALVRRIFIAVNNPWLCSINDDPVKICKDMDYIVQEQPLTDRLGLRTDFIVDGSHGLFPVYKLTIHLEAVGTRTAIDLGEIISARVKDMTLIIKVKNNNETMEIRLQTECEDLNDKEYLMKKNKFEIRNVNTYENNY